MTTGQTDSAMHDNTAPNVAESSSVLKKVVGGIRLRNILHVSHNHKEGNKSKQESSTKVFQQHRGSIEVLHLQKATIEKHKELLDPTSQDEVAGKSITTKPKIEGSRSIRKLLHLPAHKSSAKKKPEPFQRHRGSMEHVHMKLAAFKRTQETAEQQEEQEIMEAFFLQTQSDNASTTVIPTKSAPVIADSSKPGGTSLRSLLRIPQYAGAEKTQRSAKAFQNHRGSMEHVRMHISAADAQEEMNVNLVVQVEGKPKKAGMSVRNLLQKSQCETKPIPFQNHRGSMERVHMHRSTVELQHREPLPTDETEVADVIERQERGNLPKQKEGGMSVRNLLHKKSHSEKNPFQTYRGSMECMQMHKSAAELQCRESKQHEASEEQEQEKDQSAVSKQKTKDGMGVRNLLHKSHSEKKPRPFQNHRGSMEHVLRMSHA